MGVSFRNEKYLYSAQSIAPPQLNTHLHRYYEFLLFESGEANYIIEDTVYEAHPGDLFVTRPGELHTLAFLSDNIYTRQFIQVPREFGVGLEVDLFRIIDRFPTGQMNRIPAGLVNAYSIPSYYIGVRKYIEVRVPESDMMVRTYIIQLLMAVNYALSKSPHKRDTALQLDSRVRAIMHYIDKNISEELSLDRLAGTFYMNKYYMCHLFKDNTGFTIKEYINTRRIARAKELLAGGRDVMSLCFDCGFRDYSTFYKTFRRLTGKTPREFFRAVR